MVRDLRMKILFVGILVFLYHIVGDKSIFLYVFSLSLYKIFLACFHNVTIKNVISKYDNDYVKYQILKKVLLVILVISLIFLLLGIFISDITLNLLKINNSFLTFLLMGFSICIEPITIIVLEYLECFKYKKCQRLYNVYCYLETGLFVVIAIISFLLLNIHEEIACALLYLSKIISGLIINGIIYLLILRKKHKKIKHDLKENKINYKECIKEIFNYNNLEKIIMIVKELYYYFSIIILYLMLSKRYSYMIEDVEEIIVFIYLYVLNFVILLGDLLNNRYLNKGKILLRFYYVFEKFLSLTIILGIMAPLLCRVIFNNADVGSYLVMGVFLGMFILLYKITFKEIKNKRLGYVSLISGIIVKIVLMVPLIDSFYRMGYNLVYGDIISTIIGMSISITINYIYFKTREKGDKYFERILRSFYENIILCILLVVMQFIIPIKTDSYLMSLILIFVYGVVSLLFLKFIRKKRV